MLERKIMKDNELLNITGGGFKTSLAIIVGSIIVFIAGIIDGYLRPLKCNK